jgi:hypothetical protein
VLDRGAVYLGDEPARSRQFLAVNSDPFSEILQLDRRILGVFSATSADIDAEFILA